MKRSLKGWAVIRAGEGELGRFLPLTRRLFPVDIKVRKREATEIDGDFYFALEADLEGSVDDLVSLNRHWQEELARPPSPSGWSFYAVRHSERLSVNGTACLAVALSLGDCPLRAPWASLRRKIRRLPAT